MGPDCQALPCVRRCSWWVPAVRGANHFFACNMDALPCVRRCSWWIPAVRGKTFFCEIWWPVRWVPAVRWRNNYFARNKEALPCCGRGPSCQRLHAQYSSDGSRSLTTLTTPCREHQGGGRRRGLGRWTTARPRKGTTRIRGRHGSGCPHGEEYEGSLVRLRCEAAVAAE